MLKIVFSLLLVFAALSVPIVADTAAEISSPTEHSRLAGSDYLTEGGQVLKLEIIEPFYVSGKYAPAWHDHVQVAETLNVLADSYLDGLDPRDYHHAGLVQLWRGNPGLLRRDDRLRARFDVLLGDGLPLCVRYFVEGKVDPAALAALDAPQQVIGIARP